MPSNKKHHYVPRFYLKHFSVEGTRINLFNVPRGLAVTGANLKNQCYRDYMYGKENQAEQQLSILESVFADLLKGVLVTERLPQPMSADHVNLSILTLLQQGRTAYSADAMDEMTDGWLKAIFSKDPRIDPKALSSVVITRKDSAGFMVATMLCLYPLIMDLEFKLLKAPAGSQFITSDNPVVFYNQLMEFESHGSATGLASKGLQIFFPLSPHHLLLFFDPKVYAFGPRAERCIQLTQKADIDQLNALQVVNALENIYFAGPESNIYKALDIGKRYRRAQKTRIVKGPERLTPTGGSQLIGATRVEVRTGLSLSCKRLLKPAKRWREDYRRLGPKPLIVVRNEQLVRQHDAFLKLVDKQQYKHGEFYKYLQERPR